MEHLEGSHGTSSYRAHGIEKRGFKVSKGRGGKGAYFWRKSAHYRGLAIAWFRHQESRGVFRREPTSECAVIFVQMDLEEDQLLDLEDASIKDKIYELSEQKRIDAKDPSQIASLYDLYVSELEKELGHAILVTIIRVAPLKEYAEYPIILLGAPICFIARDASIPRIQKIEIVN